VKENLVNSGWVHWILSRLNDWTWFIAEYRVWVIVVATVIGLASPVMGAARRHGPRAAPSLMIRSGALALGFSAAVVTVCSLMHFSDLRWLPVAQRGSVHLSAPSGLFSFAKPIVVVVNSVAGIPAEFRATQIAVHTAIVCAFIALAAAILIAVTWRRARRADIRQIVRDELRRTTVVYARET
jgi:hypothetical protein